MTSLLHRQDEAVGGPLVANHLHQPRPIRVEKGALQSCKILWRHHDIEVRGQALRQFLPAVQDAVPHLQCL
jgi:hypothetical protein